MTKYAGSAKLINSPTIFSGLRKVRGVGLAGVLLALLTGPASAQTSGTWTGGTGNYSNTGNWSGGTVASGSGATMTVDLTGNATITFDTGATIGNLALSRSNTGQSLTLQGSGTTLTFSVASGTPLWDITSYYSTFDYVTNLNIAGSQGLTFHGRSNALVLQSGTTWTGFSGTVTEGLAGSGSDVESMELYAQGNNVLSGTDFVMNAGNSTGYGNARLIINGGTTQTIGALSNTNNGSQTAYISAYGGSDNFFATPGGSNTLGSASAATLQVGNGGDSGTFTGIIGATTDGLGTNGADATSGVAAANADLNIVKIGSGTQTLSGTNVYTGSTTISNGVLAVGGAGQLGAGTYSNTISNSGTFVYGSTAAQTLSGAISGTGALTDTGTGTLTLSGSNSYTGTTTVGSGTTTSGTASTLVLTGSNGGMGSAAVNVGNGATLQLQANAGNTSSGTSNALSSTAALGLFTGSTVQLLSDGSVTFAGGNSIGGNGTSGNSVYNFVVNNLGTNGDTASNQTLAFASSGFQPSFNGFGQTATINVSGGSGYTLALGNLTIGYAGNLNLNTTTANLVLAGISGTSDSVHVITKTGADTVSVTGAIATNYGPLTLAIQQGTFVLGTGSSISVTTVSPGQAGVTLGNSTTSGVLQLGDANSAISPTFTALGTSGSGTANAIVGGNSATSTLTVNASTAQTYGGTLGGGSTYNNNLALAVGGTSTLTLSGSNTYSGGTTVSTGTLIAGNPSGSATGTGSLTVSGGATIGGTGMSSGTSFSVNGGSTATRANVLGGLNYAGDSSVSTALTLQGSGASTIEDANLTLNINSAIAGAVGSVPANSGTQLKVGNTALTFGTDVQSTLLTLNVVGGNFIPYGTGYVLIAGTAPTGGTGANGSQYTNLSLGSSSGTLTTGELTPILNSGSSGSGNLTFTLTGGGTNSTYTGSYLALYQNSTTGADNVVLVLVPEPHTWAMILAGLGALVFWQRRRNPRA